MKGRWGESEKLRELLTQISKSNIQNIGMYLINTEPVKSTVRTVTALRENTLCITFEKILFFFYGVIDIALCKFKYTLCRFDALIYCKIITATVLVNTSIISHNYHFFFVVRTFKIYSFSNFRVYNTLLVTIITILNTRSPKHIHLTTESLYLLTNVSPFPLSHSPW